MKLYDLMKGFCGRAKEPETRRGSLEVWDESEARKKLRESCSP